MKCVIKTIIAKKDCNYQTHVIFIFDGHDMIYLFVFKTIENRLVEITKDFQRFRIEKKYNIGSN